MVRSKQAGSVASFVIIGGILVLAAAGALYWAGQQRSSDDVTTTPEVTVPVSTDDQASEDTKKDENASDKSPSSTAPGKEAAPDTESSSGEQPKVDTSSENQVAELSHTGPVDSFAGIFAAGILTGSIIAFAQSRRRDATL